MTWAGCYALDLYCDNQKKMGSDGTDGVHGFDEFPHQYTAETGGECRSTARKAGWIIHSDGTCICPKCSGKTPQVREYPAQKTVSVYEAAATPRKLDPK